MEKLGLHIVELLNGNPQVYLPGIGVFKKERIAAAFDEHTNSFTAPSQRIILSNHEKGSAKLLIQSISHDEEITDEESEAQLKKVIGAILLEVNEKGKVNIPGLGKLLKEQESLTFIQEKIKKEALPFYKSVKDFKLLPSSVKTVIPVTEETEPTLESSSIEEEVETTVSSEPEMELPRRSLNWLWPTLILLAVVCVGTYWYVTTPQLGKKNTTQELPKPVAVLDSSQTDSLMGDSLSNTSADSLNKAANTPSQTSEQTPPALDATTFEIIVVSFGKIADAQQYVQTMKERGHEFHILENRRPGNQIKVSYGSYATEAEAQIALNKVRESFVKEAWIYKKIQTK